MVPEPDEIRRAQSGDRMAFEMLVRRYQRRVYITAFRILGNHSDADDVAQEAFLRAYRGLGTFDGRCDFFTWLYRIVVNVALNHLRGVQRRRIAPLEETSHDLLTTHDPREQSEAREMCSRMAQAIAALQPSLRVTVVLALLEGLPHKKVGEILGCSEGTVAWRVNQARKELRRALARYGCVGSERPSENQARVPGLGIQNNSKDRSGLFRLAATWRSFLMVDERTGRLGGDLIPA